MRPKTEFTIEFFPEKLKRSSTKAAETMKSSRSVQEEASSKTLQKNKLSENNEFSKTYMKYRFK